MRSRGLAGAVKSAPLLKVFRLLYDHFGPRHWWPAETPFEVIVGAILTQAVSWRNVERAVANLKARGLLEVEALAAVDEETLAGLIRPAGYYRVKARKLKAFVAYLQGSYRGRLEDLFSRPLGPLREELLSIYGIGPETADSILLYAGGYPTFVVDAYTHRVFHRLGFFPARMAYEEMRGFFLERLPPDVSLFNEYHALIDELAKSLCRRREPLCGGCPLATLCPQAGIKAAQGLAEKAGPPAKPLE